MATEAPTYETRTLKGGETRLDADIRNNPFPFYRALREQDPVHYDPGLDLYLVTRYADCVTVLADNETYREIVYSQLSQSEAVA